jgi:hypothetical protein
MRRSFYILIVISLLLLSLTSCNLPIEIVQKTPDESDMLAIEITLEPTVTPLPTIRPTPTCVDLGQFNRPFEHWPNGNMITSPNPTFTWFYTKGSLEIDTIDDWAYVCKPETYSIILSSGPDFTDEITLSVPADAMTITPDNTKLTITWASNVALEPLKTYRWFVVGHHGDLQIHDYRLTFLHSQAWNYVSDYYKNVFRTGPECVSGSIDTPVLVFPADDETISIRQPMFTWNATSCMPLVFITQLSRNPNLQSLAPGFISYASADYTFYLQTNYSWLDMPRITYGGIPPLPDCTTYYWRVLGGIGDGTYVERVWGEWSGIQSFFVNSGTCPTPTPTRIPPTKTPVPTNTPTPEPSIDCGSIGDPTTCTNAGCYWKPCQTFPGCGVCVNK